MDTIGMGRLLVDGISVGQPRRETGTRHFSLYLDGQTAVPHAAPPTHATHRSGGARIRPQRGIPERKTDNSDIRKETDTDDTSTPATPTSLYSEEAKAMVLAIILRKFREPHLLKTEVLADVDNGMTAQASRFIAEVGYYNLINMFRLRYATLYKQQHPQAKQVEVAEQSGYISDQALSRAKKNVTSIDMDMVKNVTIETE